MVPICCCKGPNRRMCGRIPLVLRALVQLVLRTLLMYSMLKGTTFLLTTGTLLLFKTGTLFLLTKHSVYSVLCHLCHFLFHPRYHVLFLLCCPVLFLLRYPYASPVAIQQLMVVFGGTQNDAVGQPFTTADLWTWNPTVLIFPCQGLSYLNFRFFSLYPTPLFKRHPTPSHPLP